MHPNPTLEPRLECYGAGYALLRPEQSRIAQCFVRPAVTSRPQPETVEFIPRAELPTFVVRTQTVYLVTGAPTATRVMQWFADLSDIELDVQTIDFGTVEVLGQARRQGEPEDVRYVLTDQGRHALAMARAFDKGPTVAEVEKGGEQPI